MAKLGGMKNSWGDDTPQKLCCRLQKFSLINGSTEICNGNEPFLLIIIFRNCECSVNIDVSRIDDQLPKRKLLRSYLQEECVTKTIFSPSLVHLLYRIQTENEEASRCSAFYFQILSKYLMKQKETIHDVQRVTVQLFGPMKNGCLHHLAYNHVLIHLISSKNYEYENY